MAELLVKKFLEQSTKHGPARKSKRRRARENRGDSSHLASDVIHQPSGTDGKDLVDSSGGRAAHDDGRPPLEILHLSALKDAQSQGAMSDQSFLWNMLQEDESLIDDKYTRES